MPHKRNPVHAIVTISAARLAIGLVPVVLSAMVQEHERAAGAWQSEWSSIPDIFRFTVGSLDRVGRVLNELELDPQRMQANLELSQGLIMAEAVSMALAQRLGRPAAYQLVQTAISRARTTGVSFRQALLEADVSADVVDPALDPTNYLGCTNLFIDRALAEYLGLKTD